MPQATESESTGSCLAAGEGTRPRGLGLGLRTQLVPADSEPESRSGESRPG